MKVVKKSEMTELIMSVLNCHKNVFCNAKNLNSQQRFLTQMFLGGLFSGEIWPGHDSSIRPGCCQDFCQVNWLAPVKAFYSHWGWGIPALPFHYLDGVFLWEHFCPCRVGPWRSSNWRWRHQIQPSHEPTAYVCHLQERYSKQRKKKCCSGRPKWRIAQKGR